MYVRRGAARGGHAPTPPNKIENDIFIEFLDFSVIRTGYQSKQQHLRRIRCHFQNSMTPFIPNFNKNKILQAGVSCVTSHNFSMIQFFCYRIQFMIEMFLENYAKKGYLTRYRLILKIPNVYPIKLIFRYFYLLRSRPLHDNNTK